MTKEEWIKVRDKTEISMETWYSYYRDCGGKISHFPDFVQAFSEILIEQPYIMSRTGPKAVTLSTAVKRMYQYYNQKFGI